VVDEATINITQSSEMSRKIMREKIERDIVVKMPPKRKFTIKAKIIVIKEAVPRIVVLTDNQKNG
jgi:hypothetical protein